LRTASLHCDAVEDLDRVFLPPATAAGVVALLPQAVREPLQACVAGRCRAAATASIAACLQPALLHGDATASNVRVLASAAGRRLGLLDFADAIAGDPLYDWVAFAASVLRNDVAAVAAATFAYNAAAAANGAGAQLVWDGDTRYRATCLLSMHPVDAFGLLASRRPDLLLCDSVPTAHTLWHRLCAGLWPHAAHEWAWA